MLVTQHPVFRRFWYPIVPIIKLLDGPRAFCLLGQPLVLWLDNNGQPAAVEDRCCHRSAKLSMGIVKQGCLQCPYHGWMFDRQGTCVNVPQIGDRPIPQTYRVEAFQCISRYGYVWVCLGPPIANIPTIPEANDPRFRFIPEFDETWTCAALRLMENSFDNAHPHFVHKQTFGIENNPIPPIPNCFEETPDGFWMTYDLAVSNPEEQKRNLQIADDFTVRRSESHWFLPFLRTLKITYPSELVHLIVTAATPIDDRSIQVLQFCLRNDAEAQVKASDVIAFDRQVTLEDKVVLESTDWDVPLDIQAEQHMASDMPGIVMRRRLSALIAQYEPQH